MRSVEAKILKEEKTANEIKSFKQYIDSIVKDIPDMWDITEYEKRPDETITVNFTWLEKEVKTMAKYWAWTLLNRLDYQASTIRAMVGFVSSFFRFANQQFLPDIGDEINHRAWENYIDNLKNRVKSSIAPENSAVSDEDGPLQSRTAGTYASNTLMFLAQLARVNNGYEWVFNYDSTALLPHDVADYLTSKEKMELKDQLIKLQFQRKTDVIPYDELLMITRALEQCDDIYLKTAVKVALHTGLRITEVLILKRDCLVAVSQEEIDEAMEYRRRHSIGLGGVDPDWSEMYWLKDHQVIKDKRTREWSIGTPILVSKVVYDAIEELAKPTETLREESGLDYLFLNRNGKGSKLIGVRSYSSLQLAKMKFIEKFKLPFFKFHQMRKTFATMLNDLGIPKEMIQKYLNHIKIDTTDGYISSEFEREVREMSAIKAGKMLGINTEGDKVDSFVTQVIAVTSASEWDYLELYDQLEIYRQLKRKYGVSVVYYDHGFCMLSAGEKCQHGYGEVKACHLSNCGCYEPDADELPTFIDMLKEREKAAPELKKTYEAQMIEHPEHKDDLQSRMREFEDDTATLVELIKKLQNELAEV